MSSIVKYMNNQAAGYKWVLLAARRLPALMCMLPAPTRGRTRTSWTVAWLADCDRTGCRHPPITSYFYWVWNADSLDTGGILNMDWRSIAWERVDLLSKSLGLSPWYKYAPTAKG